MMCFLNIWTKPSVQIIRERVWKALAAKGEHVLSGRIETLPINVAKGKFVYQSTITYTTINSWNVKTVKGALCPTEIESLQSLCFVIQ